MSRKSVNGPQMSQQPSPSRPQCWECRRRRHVCDGMQPVCAKCQTARIVCPGYADKRPLTWVTPGQAMSRPRKAKPSSKRNTAQKSCNDIRDRGRLPIRAAPSTSQSPGTGTESDSHTEELDLPAPVELRPEVCDIIDAMLYYNSHIYPDLIRHQLGPNSFVIPLTIVENCPPAITHTLVSITISHRILQVAEDPASDQAVKPLWTRLYRHRDIAVRVINKLVADEKTRKDIATVVSVYTLLFAMLQQSFKPCWRTHVDGLMSLVRLWGSLSAIIQAVPGMELSMMALCIVSVLANTTSPRDNQLQVASTEEILSLSQTYYTETFFPSIPMPPALFAELVLINALRAEAPSDTATAEAELILSRIESFDPQTWSATRPAAEREDPTLQADWLLIATLFHAAVALYAILSLQSSGALPCSSASSSASSYSPSPSPSTSQQSPETKRLESELEIQLELSRARHARQLFALLESGMSAPRVRKRMTWPLLVAGVEAASRGASWEVQRYIGACLSEMGRDQGSAAPGLARRVLERFCLGGGSRWDECFAEPFALVM
ncbi:fungal-specific transcription factor domain-containing protein [Chaetomium strumarium]|uniref:Fungal-specific transcription factor domain-containing protein n=1 Tax=Chaetomium strumarium TaxID=1170767 RepID=A0AAJ0H3D6_9PEZI|nr:fungal-specific transcription factor domain-containing protein [Chaetomium strumarium]